MLFLKAYGNFNWANDSVFIGGFVSKTNNVSNLWNMRSQDSSFFADKIMAIGRKYALKCFENDESSMVTMMQSSISTNSAMTVLDALFWNVNLITPAKSIIAQSSSQIYPDILQDAFYSAINHLESFLVKPAYEVSARQLFPNIHNVFNAYNLRDSDKVDK